MDKVTKEKFIKIDNEAVNTSSFVEKEKQLRKERHREWMRINDERYNLYSNLINN